MRVLFWLAILVLAALGALFAISNRQSVALGLWPLPFFLQTRLYLLVFIALLIGAAAGVVGAWISGHRRRRELRLCLRRTAALERELAATQAQLNEHGAPPSLPAHG